MKQKGNLKILSIVLTTGACIMSMVSDLVRDKKQEEEIKAEIDRQVALRLEAKEES